jgi:membrane fusion protein, multidrug efflux system
MANFIGRVIGAAAFGGLLGGAMLSGTGCGKSDGATAGSDKKPPALVNVSPAILRDAPVYLDEIGKTTARETVTIMPQVVGRIAAIHFQDGADLKKDTQLLFTIDDRPFKAALQQAQAQLDKDRAASKNADAFFARQAKVYDQKFIAESDYDTAKYNAEGAKATVAADEAAVANAKLNVEYCSIYSPIEGRAGMRLVDPGNIIKVNQALLVIQRLDPIYADFMINDRELPDVRKHMADHTLKALAKLPTDTENEARQGDLTFLDNAVQDASGTIKLRATLPNADRHFWPGQYVNVRLVLMVKKDAVLVPMSAPQLGQNGSYVYVIKPDSTADLRPVTLGQKHVIGPGQDIYVVVEKGVAGGERVVVNGQLTLFPGAPVQIEPMKDAPAAGPSTKPSTQPSANPPGSSVSLGGDE